MEDFLELNMPHYSPPFGWGVMVTDAPDDAVLFLARDCTVKTRDRIGGFFWHLEKEALAAMATYYADNGRNSPHCEEDVESQPMVFE